MGQTGTEAGSTSQAQKMTRLMLMVARTTWREMERMAWLVIVERTKEGTSSNRGELRPFPRTTIINQAMASTSAA